MISAKAFDAGMRILEQYYRKPFDGSVLVIWLDFLSANLTDDQFIRGVKHAIIYDRFLPTPSDLVRYGKGVPINKGQHELIVLVNQVEEIAKKKTDGHYTILKFTMCYQGVLGTISSHQRKALDFLPRFSTLAELLQWMIEEEFSVYDIPVDS